MRLHATFPTNGTNMWLGFSGLGPRRQSSYLESVTCGVWAWKSIGHRGTPSAESALQLSGVCTGPLYDDRYGLIDSTLLAIRWLVLEKHTAFSLCMRGDSAARWFGKACTLYSPRSFGSALQASSSSRHWHTSARESAMTFHKAAPGETRVKRVPIVLGCCPTLTQN